MNSPKYFYNEHVIFSLTKATHFLNKVFYVQNISIQGHASYWGKGSTVSKCVRNDVYIQGAKIFYRDKSSSCKIENRKNRKK